MTVWSTLTPVQAESIRAAAVLLLRDADELAVELQPLLVEKVSPTAVTEEIPVQSA